jgi:hypothetical protein
MMNRNIRFLAVMLILVLALNACQAPGMAPEAAVQALADALNAGDVDAAMTVMSDNPAFNAGEPLSGADEVRALYEELVAGNFHIEPTVVSVEEGVVKTDTLTWGDGIPTGLEPFEADEVYVVEDGRITSITWTPTEATQEKIADFMAQMEAEEPVFTVTFEGDQCSVSGMDTLTAGQPVTMKLDVTDQDEFDQYGFVMVTLHEGWTKADLEDWKQANQPYFVHSIASIVQVNAGKLVEGPKFMPEADSYNFKEEAYLVCLTAHPLSPSNIVGPIKMVTE